jgi:glucosamine--fructose-6-phosphate aminotransferase (isomerizing)
MCGIVGYIGEQKAEDVLIEGLKKLEYRGYDSAGIAVYKGGKADIKKYKGRLSVLEEHLKENPVEGVLGIGHTRWATHGAPSDINSHPHSNSSGDIVVVHNGIIENYLELKDELEEKGFEFNSETDTEVIAHLLDDLYTGDIVETVQQALLRLHGSYALGVISTKEPDKLIGVRKDSPLIVGLGKGENFIASDIPAILKYTRKVYFLEDDEVVILQKNRVEILDKKGNTISKEAFDVNWDIADAEKGGYRHFMIKEIEEQPKALRDTMTSRVIGDKDTIELDKIKLTKDELDKINKIFIVACGTAYHAGMVGKYAIERFARLPVEAEVASEFRYKLPIVDENSLIIVVSQSGETADTMAALRLAKKKGARIMAVTNVVGSSVSREADDVLYTWAGPEIAVASTKAYITQLNCMYLIALHIALELDKITLDFFREIRDALKETPNMVEEILKNKHDIQRFADHNFNAKNVFFIGRGLDYYTALEGSLKLKEISYVHSEAYAAGELKHGTIALIEEGSLVVALATQKDLYEKMISNIKEVKARGAYVLAIAQEDQREVEKVADEVFYIPKINDHITSIPIIPILQLIAYYIAVARGCDVDKPRNLAKSVTVE